MNLDLSSRYCCEVFNRFIADRNGWLAVLRCLDFERFSALFQKGHTEGDRRERLEVDLAEKSSIDTV